MALIETDLQSIENEMQRKRKNILDAELTNKFLHKNKLVKLGIYVSELIKNSFILNFMAGEFMNWYLRIKLVYNQTLYVDSLDLNLSKETILKFICIYLENKEITNVLVF